MKRAIDITVQILNSDIIQGICSMQLNTFHEKDFNPEEDIAVPEISIPMEIETPKVQSPPIPPAPPLIKQDEVRHVARATAHKIVEESGPLSSADARTVAQEIREADVSRGGIPVAPELSAELEEILRTGKYPTEKAIAAPKVSTPVIPKKVTISQTNVNNLFGEMKAAFEKKGIRKAVTGDDEEWTD